MIVGLCGDISSGKDVVGSLLVEEFGFVRYSFAEPIKEWVLSLVEPLGVEPRHIFGANEKTKQADMSEPLEMLPWQVRSLRWTGRSLLEYLGTDVGRAIHPDVWVQRFVHTYNKVRVDVPGFEGNTPRVVITDVRYPNEFAAIRKLGGVIWRTRLDVEHELIEHEFDPMDAILCPADKDWRNACACGVIESTGHASDTEWRSEAFDLELKAPKPGVDQLHAQARYAMTSLLS